MKRPSTTDLNGLARRLCILRILEQRPTASLLAILLPISHHWCILSHAGRYKVSVCADLLVPRQDHDFKVVSLTNEDIVPRFA